MARKAIALGLEGKDNEVRKERTARKGWQGKDCKERMARKGLQEKDGEERKDFLIRR